MDKGAHFYRCDLQIHTPRDTNWKGQTPVSDADRSAYAVTLVRECRKQGIHAVAITDHHDMAFVSYIRDAATRETDSSGAPLREEEKLVVFPGMELTLGVPCQALLIFDADFPSDMFPLAMGALAIDQKPDDARKIAQVRRLDNIPSLKVLKEKLDERTYLRDRYIVFPHVGENREFSLIRKGLAGKYIDMPFVGGFVDGTLDRLGRGARTIVDGKDANWGNKRIACFQTSDSRREDHADLGRATTWIKWAVPTAEALRQACLAQESRVSQTTPRIPDVHITSISVSNSSFLGPFHLEFNPQYSALIGGRGTGKSTILEYLRWALCDQPPVNLDEVGIPNYEARRKRLIENTLEPLGATVEVRFEVHGVAHSVRRDSQSGSILLKIGTNEMVPCTEDDVRSLLPIQAYSQKQLSDVSVRVDELSRFVTTPIRTELEVIERQLKEREEEIRQAYARVRRRRALRRMMEERGLLEKSMEEQANALRSSLTGLSEEDQIVLSKRGSYAAANQVVESWLDGARSVQERAEELRAAIHMHQSDAQEVPEEPERRVLQDAFEQYRALLANAWESVDKLIANAKRITEHPDGLPLDSPWGRWSRALAEFRKEYDAAVERSSAQREKMGQLKRTERQLQEEVRGTSRVKDEYRALEAAEQKYRKARSAWKELMLRRDDILDEQCTRLTEESGNAIRASVKRYVDATQFVQTIKRSIVGSRVSGGKIDRLGQAITEASSVEVADRLLENVLADLEKLADFDIERDGRDHMPGTPALQGLGMTAANVEAIGRRMSLDDWLILSLTPIVSEPVFEYRAREQDYIAFSNASAGQQATALLATLLNQEGPPLIIDQPEEDLDNPVILDVVSSVWDAKQKRQLVFASHNANLVVNGDAELVAWCDYRTAADQSRGRIAGEGAIDVDDTRTAIKKIMEGGEAAFNLRKEKYGF